MKGEVLEPGDLVVPHVERGMAGPIKSCLWADNEKDPFTAHWNMLNKLGIFEGVGIVVAVTPERLNPSGRAHAVMLIANGRLCWAWNTRIRKA